MATWGWYTGAIRNENERIDVPLDRGDLKGFLDQMQVQNIRWELGSNDIELDFVPEHGYNFTCYLPDCEMQDIVLMYVDCQPEIRQCLMDRELAEYQAMYHGE